MPQLNPKIEQKVLKYIQKNLTASGKLPKPIIQVANQFGVHRQTLSKMIKQVKDGKAPGVVTQEEKLPVTECEKNYKEDTGSVTTRSLHIRTAEEALRYAEVDTDVWEIDRYIVNSWEVTTKLQKYKQTSSGDTVRLDDEVGTYTNYQVKVWLRRKQKEVRAMEVLLTDLSKQGKKTLTPYQFKIPKKPRRQLEISVVDPHLGLRCHKGGSDHNWSMDECEQTVKDMVEHVLADVKPFGPFEKIIFPFGNDFLHVDNVWGCTTQGTNQSEAEAWQHIYIRAEKLVLWITERLRKEAPLKIITVPGNHDRQSAFTMGRLLQAYYHQFCQVEVLCDASPYKFHKYGVNLIGFEHGHSIKNTVRLAALMANECRDIWASTCYREWHLGDQHRKGSSKPSMMEEQGVSIEFLPGLTPPNEWHRLKSFNWQKRAGLGFVWDYDAGLKARVNVNMDSYSGTIMRPK